MALLELRGVTRRFPAADGSAFSAVEDVSLTVEPGEFFTLLGPSGCGKTTLLRLVGGFDRPDDGSILLDGRDLAEVPPERRPIHTVFQSYALFPHMSVADNVAFPLRMARLTSAEVDRRVAEALQHVRLAEKAAAMPDELSGGQRQRVALARALINRPRLLLLDEALAALDPKLREEMQLELIRIQREVGIAFVFVTHTQSEALALSHRIAVMNRGHIEQVDTPERIYAAPRNRFVADFIGSCNMLPARVVGSERHALRLDVPGLGEVIAPLVAPVATGTNGVLALRPEQLRLYGAGVQQELRNHFAGTVRALLYTGNVTTYTVELANGQQLSALAANDAPGSGKPFRVGDAVRLMWRHDSGLFLTE